MTNINIQLESMDKMVSVPRVVEKIIKIPVVETVEKIVEIMVEVPVEKIVEKVVEVPVEKIVEKLVEVPVESADYEFIYQDPNDQSCHVLLKAQKRQFRAIFGISGGAPKPCIFGILHHRVKR